MGPVATARREVLERVFNALWREDFAATRRLSRVCRHGACCAVVALPDGTELLAPVRGIAAFGLLRTGFPYYVRRPDSAGPEPILTAEEVLDLLPDETGMLAQLADEVRQSEANMSPYLGAASHRRPKGAAFLAGVFARERPLLRPEEYLESWILRGHPVHPGSKTRWGFDERDVRRYSPEFARPVDLGFAAVRRALLVEAGADGDAGYPRSWQAELDAERRARGVAPEEYECIAVHPWQAERVLPGVFDRELVRQDIILLGARLPAQPLASIRTMVPLAEDAHVHLKLPLAIQSTSALRTISAPSVQNGPAFSRWIGKVVEAEGLSSVCGLLAEPRGLHFWEHGRPQDDPAGLERAKNLSMIFRCRPAPQPGAWTVPAALLAEPSPADGRPVVRELAGGPGPVPFFERYASVTARAVLPFFFRGIALEAHGKNCLMRFKDGEPCSVVIRDLGGLRVHAAWAREFAPLPLQPATAILAHEPEDLVAKLHHAWLQGHLAPVARALAESFAIPERALWRAAAGAIQEAWDSAAAPHPARRVGLLEAAFFKPWIRVKALTRMRLNRRYNTYDFSEVPNPLSAGSAVGRGIGTRMGKEA